MSELMQSKPLRDDFRRQLLGTVSSLVLLATAYSTGNVNAAESEGGSTVWIELGGQLERVDGGQSPYLPPGSDAIVAGGFPSPAFAQRPARYSNGLEGKIEFDPSGSDWSFSASIRYGRSNASRHVHLQKDGPSTVEMLAIPLLGKYYTQTVTALTEYSDLRLKNTSTHAVLDFEAGRDVGIGIFGKDSRSKISFGARIAQFISKSDVDSYARPDDRFEFKKQYFIYAFNSVPISYYHNYQGHLRAARSFDGIGPSIKLTSSLPLVGDDGGAQFDFDWGINAAVLFGRQKADVRHSTMVTHHYAYISHPTAFPGKYVPIGATSNSHSSAAHSRSRSVVVPNVGGFAGVSLKFPNAKVSLGYRADIFFGAMDVGIDARKSDSISFYGPFATISIGLP